MIEIALRNGALVFLSALITSSTGKYFYPHSIPYNPYPGLPPLPSPALDYLCEGRDGMVFFLPWDCRGYMRCYHNNAYWTSCPFDSRSVGVMEPICILEKAKCQARASARWQEFCRKTGGVAHPSPSNCAVYYNCGVGQEGDEKRCPYLTLFNPVTRRCEDFRTTESLCGTRYVPKSPCEYPEYQSCGGSVLCLPCEDRTPSCVGLADGHHEIRPNYSIYMECESERTVALSECPDNTVFTSGCGCVTSSAVIC